jgi:hypothetical protein
MADGQEMTHGRSILEDLRLAEEVGMVFPEAVVEEAEAEVDELGALNTAQLRTRGKSLGVVPVGDKRKAEVWRQALQAARAAVQEAAVLAATAAAAAAAATHASATSATATAVTAAEELRKRGRVWKLAPSDGWQKTAAAVVRRVVEDEQEDGVEVGEVVREEDLSGEEADSSGPVKWGVPGRLSNGSQPYLSRAALGFVRRSDQGMNQ